VNQVYPLFLAVIIFLIPIHNQKGPYPFVLTE